MSEGMCYECGIFFEKPVFEVHDLHNYKVQQKRDYKKLHHFNEVLRERRCGRYLIRSFSASAKDYRTT
jgi:hypothetical protein